MQSHKYDDTCYGIRDTDDDTSDHTSGDIYNDTSLRQDTRDDTSRIVQTPVVPPGVSSHQLLLPRLADHLQWFGVGARIPHHRGAEDARQVRRRHLAVHTLGHSARRSDASDGTGRRVRRDREMRQVRRVRRDRATRQAGQMSQARQ